MIEPYNAVGLIPSFWGIRRREDMAKNLEHIESMELSSRVGGSTQSTGTEMRLAPSATAKPATLGIFTVSASTAVPSARGKIERSGATSALLCPVCCMMKATSAPPRPAEVAKPMRSE
jgi:hypothetical protein